MLNRSLTPGCATLLCDGKLCRQIFSVNYGLVNYVEWDTHRTNTKHLSNPIIYTYMKDAASYAKEKELRISLSAIGIGQFALKDGTSIQFPPSLQMSFDFREAITNATIQEILLAPGSNATILTQELSRIHIEATQRQT